MKKLLPLFLVLSLSTALAVDMKGKIGMGVGWTTGGFKTSFAPDYAITKFGLDEDIVLEPVFHFFFSSISNGTKTSYYEVDITMLLAYALMAHKKTNLYAKAGINLGLVKTPKTTSFGIPFGLGLEHFLSDHFAVNLNAGMGFGYTSVSGGGKQLSFTLSNSLINAGLVWYY